MVNKILLLCLVFLFLFVKCSTNVDMVNDKKNKDIPNDLAVDVNKLVTINTDNLNGEFYNFWSTRPMINQTRFLSSNFVNTLDPIKKYVKSYNMVRVLGGRTDNKNTFYLGVDGEGKIKTQFSGLLSSMRAFMNTGFKPRIVLDNVPWAMTANKVIDTYGNSKPADNYDLWRQYINSFLTTLINEFGIDEVKTWRFRVATEPNYVPHHWNGTKEQFFRHYDITVDEVLKVIPRAIIGPGNLLTENAAKWKTEIIDHCANGVNYATGDRGTKMSFFCLSYYEKIDQNTIRFKDVVTEYRNKLNSYPQFKNIPFDIQEFGVLRGDNGKRGLSLSDATEYGASWYAAIADLAFQNKITEIYDWGQESEGLPSGRRNVTEMFLKLENGERLQAVKPTASITNNNHYGVIPVRKEGKYYVLIYNHNTARANSNSRVVFPRFKGEDFSTVEKWKMNQWTVDKTNGVFMNELYKDVKAAGIGVKDGRIYGNRVDDYFQEGWKNVFTTNKSKYSQLAVLPQTIKDSIISTSNNELTLKVDMKSNSVKLIEITPVNN